MPGHARAIASSPSLHASALAAHGTTVLCVRKDGETVMLADGQVGSGTQRGLGMHEQRQRGLEHAAHATSPSLCKLC